MFCKVVWAVRIRVRIFSEYASSFFSESRIGVIVLSLGFSLLAVCISCRSAWSRFLLSTWVSIVRLLFILILQVFVEWEDSGQPLHRVS